ncbi:hypothetical protein A2853_03240 [Candidatus Kaiserbacteria bacterium RIFCSPHIGHO2_01_FULL_55_17]|uniref:Uncharacterized protein n=1 Tax=Candidatus Kaiserbacteria bacterium RIFCSPHIGHO2_01_FULL_55_17 TaxID=1798484 RepID=A0A1F6D9C4_9BACT|nr:MAG: hypothetical protein A2853_03240 [Candidatus Kaiserbacteria bacterium RIFCSPHIGHO2_01_FULL_55_17]
MQWKLLNLGRIRTAWKYRHEPEQILVLANVYWHVLLIAFVAILLCAALFGGWEFYAGLGGGSGNAAPPQNSRVAPLKPADLQEVVDGIAARVVNYEFLKENPPSIPDPSR